MDAERRFCATLCKHFTASERERARARAHDAHVQISGSLPRLARTRLGVMPGPHARSGPVARVGRVVPLAWLCPLQTLSCVCAACLHAIPPAPAREFNI